MMSITLGLLFVSLMAFGNGQGVVKAPENQVVQLGANARLTCTVAGDDNEDNLLSFKEMMSNPLGALIYKSDMDAPNDPDDYVIEGHYDLIVKNTDFDDAGWYTCGLLKDETPYPAYVIVVEPPVAISNYAELREGNSVNLGCSVKYGAPTINMKENQLPHLRASIGNRIVVDHKMDTYTGSYGVDASSITISFNYTAQPENDQENFTCAVITDEPSFQLTTSTPLSIKYSVSTINILNMEKKYRVGDKITCMANGNPEPTYKWTAISSMGSRTVDTNILEVTESMIGMNEWKCSAFNEVEGVADVQTDIEFEALARPSYSGSGKLTSSLLVGVMTLALAKLL